MMVITTEQPLYYLADHKTLIGPYTEQEMLTAAAQDGEDLVKEDILSPDTYKQLIISIHCNTVDLWTHDHHMDTINIGY